MSLDKSGFYDVALDLMKQANHSPNYEALYRSAISRAYYASIKIFLFRFI
jgi:hypothetical protein